MPKYGGISLSVTGQHNMKASANPVAVSGTHRMGGVAVDQDNNWYNFDATAALPAGSFMYGGISYTADGRICTTTGTPAVGGLVSGSIAIRSDGAVHVTVSAVAPTSTPVGNGRYVSPTGALHVVAN